MRKIFLILLFIGLYLNNYSKEASIDSIRIYSRFNLLEKKIKSLGKINDSLLKQQIVYKAKEDYYACALSDQSSKYSLITGILLALLALISYATFKYELIKLEKSFKDEMSDHAIKDKKIIDKYLVGLARSYVNGGNSNEVVKLIHKDKNDWIGASYFNLFATYNHFLASQEFLISNAEDNERISISELKIVKELLNETSELLDKIEEDKFFTIDQCLSFKKWLDKISNSDDEDVKDLTAMIRTKMIKKTTAQSSRQPIG
jgi:hypothetical protein